MRIWTQAGFKPLLINLICQRGKHQKKIIGKFLGLFRSRKLNRAIFTEMEANQIAKSIRFITVLSNLKRIRFNLSRWSKFLYKSCSPWSILLLKGNLKHIEELKARWLSKLSRIKRRQPSFWDRSEIPRIRQCRRSLDRSCKPVVEWTISKYFKNRIMKFQKQQKEEWLMDQVVRTRFFPSTFNNQKK